MATTRARDHLIFTGFRRKGLGIDGNVIAGSLTQLMTRPLGLKSVSNPLMAEGGTDPEPASAARQSIPLTTRTLGRAVSVLDYEDFARAYSGIAKAQAGVLQVSGVQTVAITLAAPLGKPLTPVSPVWTNLLGALKAMRTNEKLTNRVYDRAAEFYMPPIGQAIVMENLADERRHLAAIEAHIDRLTGKHHYDVDRMDREASEPPQFRY